MRAIIIWHGPVAVERDTDLAALLRLELLTVQLRRVRVREDDVVADTTAATPSTQSYDRTTDRPRVKRRRCMPHELGRVGTVQ